MPVRTSIVVGLAALVVVLGASPAFAQLSGERIRIDDAKIGLPPGRFVGERDAGRGSPIVKRGAWAPIYLELELKKEIRGGIRLRVDATDADKLRTTCFYPLLKNVSDQLPGARLKAAEFAYIPYVRTGDNQGEVKLTIVSDDEDQKELSQPKLIEYQQFRDQSTYVVLSLGSRLPGFELPAEKNQQNQNAGTRGGLRNGRVETSAITNVREMPDQWFGYQAADLVVLTTGSATGDFLDDLFDKEKSRDFKPRLGALLEWVRRGGKLVISVGSNASKLVQSELFRDILPATMSPNEPARAVDAIELKWKATESANLEPRAGKFPVARLLPNPARPARTLLPDAELTPGVSDLPIVIQAPFGLGRLTVVAFDLDQSPFLELNKKAEFWDWLVRKAGSEKAALLPPGQNPNQFSGYQSDVEDELTTGLRRHAEYFDGVPVISFGWVALFIVLYTLLIGPVEYLFLKKILGRLELTWITFPLIVLSVSAAAYFTAYAIKGKDLKINKIDVVDVDLAGGRVYGNTYFTIFSPRIDSYTITVEPRSEWITTLPNDPTPPVLVDWMAGGSGGGSGGILSRGYSYSSDDQKGVAFRTGEGLIRVPIQVWSTKAFTASWSGYLDRANPLIVANEPDISLFHPPGDPETLAGSFKNNLPVASLKDAVLIYAGKAYSLPTLTPGQSVGVVTGKGGGSLPTINAWFDTNAPIVAAATSVNYGRGRGYNETTGPTNLSLWSALFHEKAVASGTRLQNSSLRHLDQSWRISDKNKDEAILVARVDAPSGSVSETVMKDPTGASVTKLWLKGLPGNPAGRVDVPGTIRQETYIRVYIPIRPAAKK